MTKSATPELRLRSTGHPVVYEVNTAVLLQECSVAAGQPVDLGTLPDRVIDEWMSLGFDAIWLMGVWTRSAVSREIARAHPGLQNEYRTALPDVRPEDVLGSPYAVESYRVAPEFGGNASLRRLRTRLAKRGMGLLLDFVCNHTARDCQWVTTHPEYYIHGRAEEDQVRPDMFFRAKTPRGEQVIAFGRDPMFPGWTDTAQLNHRSRVARNAIIKELERIAALCDGVRCDMAMLLLNDVFNRTWHNHLNVAPEDDAPEEFWKEAIAHINAMHPDFLFLAESYWNREWDLQQLGFRYTYDKTLYERLLHEGASAVHDHLKAELEYQRRSIRFLENHDEPRAARVLPSEAWHFAAALVTATVPGMVLMHEGQMDGRAIRLPVQLGRRSPEMQNERCEAFYGELLLAINNPVMQQGEWQLLDCRAAWHDNHTWYNFLVFWWSHPRQGARLIVVNYAPQSGQCYVTVPLDGIEGGLVEFRDLLGPAVYVRDKAGLQVRGLYFDLPGYGIHMFDVSVAHKPTPA
jgi:hypothetical protein